MQRLHAPWRATVAAALCAALALSALVVLDASRAEEGQRYAVAFMSGVERKGAWVVPPELVSVAVMGGIELDLTDAILTAQVTEFRVFALMGSIEVTVPFGTDVSTLVENERLARSPNRWVTNAPADRATSLI